MKQQSKAAAAFLSSGGYVFAGKKTQPFTAQRSAVAGAMGMSWPWIEESDKVRTRFRVPIDPEELRQIPKAKRGDGTREITLEHYRDSFKDSVFALWLMLQPQQRVEEAETEPMQAKADAWKWAEEIGLRAGGQLAGEALALWIQITNELAESKGQPIVKGGNESEDVDEGKL